MSRNQTLVIDVKIVHQKEMSFDEFVKLCQDEVGLDEAAATKRWDRIFSTYSDGNFEVDDLSSYEVNDHTFHSCEDLCDERVKDLVEEFEDEEEAPKEAPKEAAKEAFEYKTVPAKYAAEYLSSFLDTDTNFEDFFAGKGIPVKRGVLEFEA